MRRKGTVHMPAKIDSTLTVLSSDEKTTLRSMIVQAINDQPPHDSSKFDAELAYELSVINWDLCNDMAGRVHLFDEWFSGIPV